MAKQQKQSAKAQDGTVYTGVVKFFNEEKGFGFINKDGGNEVFVHVSAIKHSDHIPLRKGDVVSFQEKEGRQGIQAYEVLLHE